MADSQAQSDLRTALGRKLEDIRAASLYRQRRVLGQGHGAVVQMGGQRYLNFCSNDYLGLAQHPELQAALAHASGRAGTGSGASQLITGHNREHAALEEELADCCGTERALYFSTGYAANVGTLEALLGRNDAVIADELNHASLIDGVRLSKAEKRIYPHLDAIKATGKLSWPCEGNRLLLTDSVFSMDGDLAPLKTLGTVAKRTGAWFMVDDAHGFGVLGQGRGAFEGERPGKSHTAVPMPDVYVATLGKAAGAAGAFVAGSRELIEYLIQKARSYVFSTAPPPAVAAAARAGLSLLREEHWRRERLQAHVIRFRRGARALGLPIGESRTPIQPLILGSPEAALAMSEALLRQGILVSAIRPPTVPEGTARLRITLTAGHDDEQVDRLLDGLAACVVKGEALLAGETGESEAALQ